MTSLTHSFPAKRFALLLAAFALVLTVSTASAQSSDGAGNPQYGATGDDLASADTTYRGARLLKGQQNVQAEGIEPGDGGDWGSDRYLYWQGDTLFAGVRDHDTGNKVDVITEVYWFESSTWRSSDFYVVLFKVKATPAVGNDWQLAPVNDWFSDFLDRDESAHYLEANLDPAGTNGSIRWDWSVPFDSYEWEPERAIEVESGYSAGVDANAGFSEGGVLKDLTDQSNIQAKGYVSAQHKVSTRYTITLYNWQVLVASTGTSMAWDMRVLQNGRLEDNAYHEYFLVLQAEKGTPVKLDSVDFGGAFRDQRIGWFDRTQALSAVLTNLTFSPPAGCYADDPRPQSYCKARGVCAHTQPVCDLNLARWVCPYPSTYEENRELSCDGRDNNCDGRIDEKWNQLGASCDGADPGNTQHGKIVCRPDFTGIMCDEDPCSTVQCGEGCGTCRYGKVCDKGMCRDENACDGIGAEGICDGNLLGFCVHGSLEVYECGTGCGYRPDRGMYDCLEDGAPTTQPEGCTTCMPGEVCTTSGTCIPSVIPQPMRDPAPAQTTPEPAQHAERNPCGSCPADAICAADGTCIVIVTPEVKSDAAGAPAGPVPAMDQGSGGCSAGAVPGRGKGRAWAALLLLGFAFLPRRRGRRSLA